MKVPLLYAETNILIPDKTLIINNEQQRVLYNVNKYKYQLTDGITTENLEEDIDDDPEADMDIVQSIDSLFSENLMQNIMQDPKQTIINKAKYITTSTSLLYLYRICNTNIETNNINLLLNNELLTQTISAVDYIKDKFKLSKNKLIAKILSSSNGFSSIYISIDNFIIGPLLYEELLNGYLDYYIYKYVIGKDNNPYYPFVRMLEYKKIYNANIKNNDVYITINSQKYKIKALSNDKRMVSKRNTIRMAKQKMIVFAYAKLIKKKKIYYNEQNIHNINFDRIEFYDYRGENIFNIENESIENETDAINLIAYLFSHTFNKYEYKSEHYICNLNMYYEIDKTRKMFEQ